MSDYDEFTVKETGKFLGKIFFGTLIAMGLSLLFFFTLARGTAYLFIDALAGVFGNIEVAHLTTLGVTLFTLVGPVGYLFMQNPAFSGLDYGTVAFEPILISAIITFVVAGLIVGLIMKKDWMDGFKAGIWTGIGVYIATLVMTLIALFAIGIFSGGSIGIFMVILVVSLILVMAIPSMLICGASGILGGWLYQKYLRNRY